MEYYRQCTLKSENLETVAWINESSARETALVKLKDSDDPAREWRVVAVGPTRITQTEAQEQARAAHSFKQAGSIANT